MLLEFFHPASDQVVFSLDWYTPVGELGRKVLWTYHERYLSVLTFLLIICGYSEDNLIKNSEIFHFLLIGGGLRLCRSSGHFGSSPSHDCGLRLNRSNQSVMDLIWAHSYCVAYEKVVWPCRISGQFKVMWLWLEGVLIERLSGEGRFPFIGHFIHEQQLWYILLFAIRI